MEATAGFPIATLHGIMMGIADARVWRVDIIHANCEVPSLPGVNKQVE
jgi:hypothetical protein